MKKIFLLFVLAACFVGCSKDEKKSCWIFYIDTCVIDGGSKNCSLSTTEQCDLTESEAESIRRSMESTYTMNGVTVTTKVSKHIQYK